MRTPRAIAAITLLCFIDVLSSFFFLPSCFLLPTLYRRSGHVKMISYSASLFLTAVSFCESGTTLEKQVSHRLPRQRKPGHFRNSSLQAFSKWRGCSTIFGAEQRNRFGPFAHGHQIWLP